MSFRSNLKSLIHQELFSLDPSNRCAFRYALPNDGLRNAFRINGRSLGTTLSFMPGSNSRKWKLVDGKNSYLVKDLGDHLVVLREKHPLLCRTLEFALYESKPRYYMFRWRLGRWYQQRAWTLKKRWVDKPKNLLVNIGAGVWYARDWRVLDFNGKWYRYADSYVDFQHDLTSGRPLPFEGHSVRMFYSEHVFEHLRNEWCEHIFREVHRSLQSGGGFRIVVPDADLIYDRLLKQDTVFFKSWMDRDNSTIAEAFRTLVGEARTPLDEADFARRLATMTKEEFLDWCKEGLEYDWRRTGEHINWFNFDKLARMLKAAGFGEVRLCSAQDSHFPEARGSGFDTRAWYSLHVECMK